LKVLIVGFGFIGKCLANRLLAEDGIDIRVLDRSASKKSAEYATTTAIEFVEGRISDKNVLENALRDIDVVVHSASSTIPGDVADPTYDIETNLVGLIDLLEAMRSAGTGKLVFFSSGGVIYGNPKEVPAREDSPTDPVSSYGVVKLAMEKYIGLYQHLYGIKPVILRASNPYGTGQDPAGKLGFIAICLGKLLRGETLQIWGDGSVVRDFIYIDDLMDLCSRAIHGDKTGIYNAGSGSGYSMNEIVATIESVSGREIAKEYLPGNPYDVKKIILDIEKAGKDFQWYPEVTLEEGVRRFWTHLNNNQ
jgi:UDP-glucose 4-epimerase